MARYLVCVTGASGAIYGLRLISALCASGAEVHAAASPWGSRVVLEETGRDFRQWCDSTGVAAVHDPADLAAPVSSGSFRLAGTIVVPCTMATAAAIATGNVRNLVHRAGAVALKEGWPLIVVPREAPLSVPDLRNLLTLAEAGAAIIPASPGFYHHPATIEDLVDHLVGKIMDRLGIDHELFERWKGSIK
ncbi:MAG: UbiX family flavin prenyltransferase [Spirochaetales bacterium]|nr:MAG: UbiX family flavin prenyltransferase [Spirochaetales bacterium]